ncbi:MAG: hypothetical protein ING02_14575 [Roseomonas sp.]|nr:hypothetical protein [Roseomonas sp.]
MQRVSRASAVASLPSPPAGGTPGYFTGGNPGVGQPATVPGYEWFNAVQEELLAVILRGGLTASNTDLAQVRKSLDRLFGGGVVSYSANTTLTVDDAGLVLVNASGGARSITLPAANALGGRPIQFRIVKSDNSANAVTIQRAGTDSIEGGTSVLLRYQWESLTLLSDGTGAWVVVGAGGGSRSLANPGWALLPGGLMFQWGTVSGTVGALSGGEAWVFQTAAYPLSFRNAAVFASVTPYDVLGQANERAWINAAPGQSSMSVGLSCNIAGAAMTAGYLVIGY